MEEHEIGAVERWNFSSTDWESFRPISEQQLQRADLHVDADDLHLSVLCHFGSNKSINKEERR